jgi:hypothetical protein
VAARSALGPADNLIVLLVVDLAGDLTRIEALRSALPDALGKLGPRHYVALMSAQQGLTALLDPTPDREAVVGRIRSLGVGGKAGLLDTVEAAAEIADGMLRKAAVRVAILYLTDSSVANYRADYTNPVINTSDRSDLSRRFPDRLIQDRTEQIRRVLEGRLAPLFILHLEGRTGLLEESYQNGLLKLAAETVGEAVFCRTAAEIGPALENMLERIRNTYVLTLEAETRPGRGARIRLAVPGVERLTFRSRVAVK